MIWIVLAVFIGASGILGLRAMAAAREVRRDELRERLMPRTSSEAWAPAAGRTVIDDLADLPAKIDERDRRLKATQPQPPKGCRCGPCGCQAPKPSIDVQG